jgi:hypothetical protein
MKKARRRRSWRAGTVGRAANGGWFARWQDGARRFYKSGFATHGDAERFLDFARGEIARGRSVVGDSRKTPRLRDLVEEFLSRRDQTHRASDCDRSRWKKHLAPYFGPMAKSPSGASRQAELEQPRVSA